MLLITHKFNDGCTAMANNLDKRVIGGIIFEPGLHSNFISMVEEMANVEPNIKN